MGFFLSLQDIGRITSPLRYNSNTNEVEITFSSTTVCPSNPASNYSSKITFTCQKGAELVREPPKTFINGAECNRVVVGCWSLSYLSVSVGFAQTGFSPDDPSSGLYVCVRVGHSCGLSGDRHSAGLHSDRLPAALHIWPLSAVRDRSGNEERKTCIF